MRLTEKERYRTLDETMRGLIRRTPECALHVHVGAPDPDGAIRILNGLRPHLPLLQGLAREQPLVVRRRLRSRERAVLDRARLSAPRRAALLLRLGRIR